MKLDGARVLIAGATGGFGREIARSLGAAGAALVVSGRNRDALDHVAERVAASASFVCDLTATDGPETLVAHAVDALGGLDIVVCGIGVVAFGPVADVDDETLTRLMSVNVLAPIRLARAAIGRLDRGGMIVNVSAVVADQPTAGMAAYSATKAALTAFDAAFRREARRVGVHVLDVRPPHMETGLAERPIAGTPPRLAVGRDPAAMADLVRTAIAEDRDDVDWASSVPASPA